MGRVLFVNGHVWQSQQQRMPFASWLLISRMEDTRSGSGEVLDLGTGDIPAEHREGSEVIDLEGALVLPGLQDAHIHIGSMGESAHYVELSGCQSVSEVQHAIRQHAEDNPALPWVIGTGWDQNLWSPRSSLTHFDLDQALTSGRPCLLYRRCWHAVVVNSAAMCTAGIDVGKAWASPVPRDESEGKGETYIGGRGDGGEDADVEGVEVDDLGRPTGLFRENSMKLVESAVTQASFDTRCDQFAEALEQCVVSGLTAVHTNDENAVKIYTRLQDEGRLPIRVYLTLPHDELDKKTRIANDSASATSETSEATEASPRAVGEGKAGSKGDSGSAGAVDVGRMDREGKASHRLGGPKPWSGDEGLVSWHRVKLFADGSLGAETAAMREPYVGTQNTGVLIHETAELTKKVEKARDFGFRLEVHAIGDRALSAVLDAFEAAGITTQDRPIVTHCQMASPDLISRMQKLGAVAAVQPSFVPSDASVVMKRLSPSVHASCYPWRSLLRGGVTCAGSSDAPIETHEPLRGIFDAIFRPDAPPDFNSAPVDVAAIAGSTIVQNTDPSTAAHNNSQDNSERKEQRQQQAEQPATDPDRNTPIRMEGTGVDLQRDERKQPREGGIQEVSHRSSMTSTMIRPFLPDERLTLEEAVWMYTTGGAIAAGMETRVGVIRPGFLADLTILELGCGSGPGLLENPSLLLEARVSQVWVGGSCRWDAAEATPSASAATGNAAQRATPLANSGLPGKNGPKFNRPKVRGSNPWLSQGPGRVGRCRCCS